MKLNYSLAFLRRPPPTEGLASLEVHVAASLVGETKNNPGPQTSVASPSNSRELAD